MPDTSKHVQGFGISVLSNAGASLMISLLTALWQHVRHGSVDWIGICALFILTCVVFYFLLTALRRATASPQQHPNSDLPLPSHAELLAERKSLEQCEQKFLEAEWNLKKAEERLSLFTPFQLEAIQLSVDLLKCLKTLGPEPVPKYTAEECLRMPLSKSRVLIDAKDKDYSESCEYHHGEENARSSGGPFQTDEQQLASIMASYRLLNPYYERVTASYELEFKGKIEAIRNRFIVAGIETDGLLLPIQGKHGKENIRAIAAKLWELAYKLGEKEILSENA